MRFFSIFLLFLLISCGGCKQKSDGETEDLSQKKLLAKANLSRIKDLLHKLASPQFEGRGAFTPQSTKTAILIKKSFITAGLKPLKQSWLQKFSVKGKTEQNVIGVIKGTSNSYIILGAHYDHFGTIDGKVYPGADDNGSGVSVLLETAHILGKQKYKHNLLFIAFGGEEKFMRGSRHFVKTKTVPLNKIDYMINLDMVGRNFMEISMEDKLPNGLGVLSSGVEHHLEKLLFNLAKKEKLQLISISESLLRKFGPDNLYYDSLPFSRAGVKTLFFTTGLHRQYHTPRDTVAKIKFKKLVKISRYISRLLIKLAKI
ncbi:MAG: M28 family metallopeptidase [Myxococcota bacterium]